MKNMDITCQDGNTSVISTYCGFTSSLLLHMVLALEEVSVDNIVIITQAGVGRQI